MSDRLHQIEQLIRERETVDDRELFDLILDELHFLRDNYQQLQILLWLVHAVKRINDELPDSLAHSSTVRPSGR